MKVKDFIKLNFCEEEFKEMAIVWNKCADEKLNLSVDCEEIFLKEIDTETRIAQFCLSD